MSLIKVNDLVTRYKVMGKGTSLLFLHGWGGSSASFLPLQKMLARKYKVITLDLPGFGETDFPPKPWTLEDYKNFIRAFAEKLNLKAYCLAGHSFGGRIAILLASSGEANLKGLILIASAGIKHRKSAEENVAGLVAKIGRRVMSLPLINRLEAPARYMFYKLIRRQDYYLAQGVMKETMQNIIKKDLAPLLSQIALPTLILWGDADDTTPIEDAYTMERHIPHAKLVILKGASHYLPRKNARELARHINAFLS